MSNKIVRYDYDPANPPPLTDAQREELARLAAMPDDTIDFSEIPEITDWSNAVRGKFYRPVKQQLTLRLDADLIAWFKAHPQGSDGYQTRINQALRRYVEAETKATPDR